ncbi:MAG TPA: alcohol dehydrogenase catalytic domain-containing protein [Ktedonobacteraceae bacterium]|nr:alcohol dehydrogenase catalytic domain-containing protein [Ktedonobacteraceae bacterium]
MWTSTMELSPRRVLLTRALGRFWRGAYFSSFSPLQVQNVGRQQLPARNWVRVRNRLAGICGSDLHFIYADGDFRIAPAALPAHKRSYPGHEVVGEVIEVGEDVTHVRVGDRVALQYGQNCLTTGTLPVCHACAAGNYNVCEQGQFAGPEPVGGGWSEEMLVHEQQVFSVPADISDQQAVLLEPTAVAVHAVLRHLPKPDDHVLIMGAGTMGLLVLQAVRALAPQTTISVMARYPFQVEQATRFGATHILYPQDMYNSVVRATGAKLYTGMLGNKMLLGGYDAIYDTIGTQRTLADALRWTRADGAIVMVGLDLHFMYVDLTPVWYQEVSLIGSMGHGTESWPIGTRQRRSTFDVTTDLIEQGLLHPEKLITHNFALTNYREALMAASNKRETRAIKVVFDYALLPASVVPNVRSAARSRRPVRATTAAWPAQEQADEEETNEPGQPETVGTPAGYTWSQHVQPFPPVPAESIEPVDKNLEPVESQEDDFSLRTAPVAPGENVPPASFSITDEVEQTPYITDETVAFYVYHEEPATTTVPGEGEIQRDTSEHGEEEQREPEPIIIAQETRGQESQESESEESTPTIAIRPRGRDKSGSSRKSATRKTEDQLGGTKDASGALEE